MQTQTTQVAEFFINQKNNNNNKKEKTLHLHSDLMVYIHSQRSISCFLSELSLWRKINPFLVLRIFLVKMNGISLDDQISLWME